jgi:exonuclease SbcD
VRRSVPDEDRHDIDRGAMERLLAGAAEVKLEGRIVPVTRTRATGISQGATIAEKVRLWAKVIQAKPEPLLDCLEGLQTHSPEAIAEAILNRPDESDKTASTSVAADSAAPTRQNVSAEALLSS